MPVRQLVADLALKLATQIDRLEFPVLGLVVGEVVTGQVQRDRLPGVREAIGQHGRLGEVQASGAVVLANPGRIKKDAGRAIRRDAGDDVDAGFVGDFNLQQQSFGVVLPRVVCVYQTVMRIAEQHEVVDVVRQLRRPDRIPAGPSW